MGRLVRFPERTSLYLPLTQNVVVNSNFFLLNPVFLKICRFCEKWHICKMTRSSSGYVLIDLKVLPTKSSHSQLHFSYISCHHISHQSKVTSYFLQKISHLTRNNFPFHIYFVVQILIFCVRSTKVLRIPVKCLADWERGLYCTVKSPPIF